MTCSVEGCDRPFRAKGFCSGHWRRYKNGRPMEPPLMDKRRGTPDERFDSKWLVDSTTGCHVWQDHLINGYGQFRLRKGKQVQAHKFAYERARGPVPGDLVIDHICHPIDGSCAGGTDCPHRRCVNPDHMKLETRGDNSRRCVPVHLRTRQWSQPAA
jgi:hypothetical protein